MNVIERLAVLQKSARRLMGALGASLEIRDSIVTKPFKYLIRGLVVDAVILAAISLYLLTAIALNYKGRCGVFWFFGGEGRPCPFVEYMKHEAGFIFLAILFELWWLILPALGLFPVIGYLIGHRKSKSMK